MNLPFIKKDPIEVEMAELALCMIREDIDSEERRRYQNRYMELERHRLECKKVDHDWLQFAGKALGVAGTMSLGILTMCFETDHILQGRAPQWWLGKKM